MTDSCHYVETGRRCYSGCWRNPTTGKIEKSARCGSDKKQKCHYLKDDLWCPYGCTLDALVCHSFSKDGWCHQGYRCYKHHVDESLAASLAAFGLAPTGLKVQRRLISMACEMGVQAASRKQNNAQEYESLQSAKNVIYARYGMTEAQPSTQSDVQEALARMGLCESGQNVSHELVKVAWRMKMRMAREQGASSEVTELEMAKAVLYSAYEIVEDAKDKVADALAGMGLDEMDPLVTGNMIEDQFLRCWEKFRQSSMSDHTEVMQMEQLARHRQLLLSYERFEVVYRVHGEKQARARRLLGVAVDATPQAIKTSYNSLILKFHPDKRGGQELLLMRLLNDAKTLLDL